MNNEKYKIHAVVVTHNRVDMLKQCINAILVQNYKVDKIIVVDNCSTDDTIIQVESLQKENPQIEILSLPTNEGGAGGFNEGMKKAYYNNADFVWLMDDDVLPEKNCLEELVKAKDIINGKISFLASAVRNKENKAMNVPKIDKNQFIKYTDWYEYLEDSIVKIVKATFVSILVSRHAIEKCGLPWKPFFIWGDDSEYTQRIIRDFSPAYMVGKSKVVHLRSSSDELSIIKEENKERIPLYFYYYRNNLIGFFEYESFAYKFLIVGKTFYDLFAVLFKAKYKLKKMGTILRALFSFILGTYNKLSFKYRSRME